MLFRPSTAAQARFFTSASPLAAPSPTVASVLRPFRSPFTTGAGASPTGRRSAFLASAPQTRGPATRVAAATLRRRRDGEFGQCRVSKHDSPSATGMRRSISQSSTSHASAVADVASEDESTLFGSAPWLVHSGDGDVPAVANFIGGSFVPSGAAGTSSFPVIDPSTNQVLVHAPQSTREELESAVRSASEAFPEWSATPVQHRQRIMMNYVHLIKQHSEEIAQWITREQGKTLPDARGDLFRGLEVVEASTHVGMDMMGDSLQNLSSGIDTVTHRVPLGVCAGIAPFNFPAMIPLWMFPLACATGNTYVMKPSEKTPGATMLLAQLAKEAGLPDGVLNVVHGGKETVDFLCEDPSIRAISFVGSNTAGEYIFDRGTKNGKRVQANLGAKNHATVLPDADRKSTARAIAGAAFGAAGQRCMALSAVILVGETRDWIADIVDEGRKLTVGNGFVEGVDVGPLITSDAKERAERIVAQAVEEGATLELDGIGVKVPGYESGNFIGPTILSNVDPANIAYTEEIFAPVLVCLSADTLDEAINMTNQNVYGNGATIFTSSGACARRFQYSIEAGQIGINVPLPVPLPFFSFTGNKASIRGDLNFYGKKGVDFFTQTKTVTSNWQYRGADLGGSVMPVMGKS